MFLFLPSFLRNWFFAIVSGDCLDFFAIGIALSTSQNVKTITFIYITPPIRIQFMWYLCIKWQHICFFIWAKLIRVFQFMNAFYTFSPIFRNLIVLYKMPGFSNIPPHEPWLMVKYWKNTCFAETAENSVLIKLRIIRPNRMCAVSNQ